VKKRFSRDRIKAASLLKNPAPAQDDDSPKGSAEYDSPKGSLETEPGLKQIFDLEPGSAEQPPYGGASFEKGDNGPLRPEKLAQPSTGLVEVASGMRMEIPGPGWARLVTGPTDEGCRLDVVLAAGFPDFSRSQLGRVAKDGRVLVDGRPVKAGYLVSPGQLIIFPPPDPPLTDLTPEPEVYLDIIYEDDQILAVNKPWGLAVHPAPGYRGSTLAGGLLAHDPRLAEIGEKFRPGLVHRLDKDTSGVLISARTESALRALAKSFSQRETQKKYLALTFGCPFRKQGVVEKPIGRHPTQRHKMAAQEVRGRPAKTLYKVLKFFPVSGISLILLTLVTGRTHQARVHLQSLGTPVLADPVYSRGVAELLNRFPQLAPGLNRQMLHARRLTIAHPLSGRPLTLRAPWPADFKFLFRELLKLENK